ncbi:unnamed protein product [Linum trigynum]|uniref:Uncharacterized protein n=1 Tax=Linum trigynum TaxID=586398 RepID=A0AAV2FYG8_9ROSI
MGIVKRDMSNSMTHNPKIEGKNTIKGLGTRKEDPGENIVKRSKTRKQHIDRERQGRTRMNTRETNKFLGNIKVDSPQLGLMSNGLTNSRKV